MVHSEDNAKITISRIQADEPLTNFLNADLNAQASPNCEIASAPI